MTADHEAQRQAADSQATDHGAVRAVVAKELKGMWENVHFGDFVPYDEGAEYIIEALAEAGYTVVRTEALEANNRYQAYRQGHLSACQDADCVLRPDSTYPSYGQGHDDGENSMRAALSDAVRDVCWKATAYGVTPDGDVAAYILPKGAIHRLVGAAQCAGISASLRNLAVPVPEGSAEEGTRR